MNFEDQSQEFKETYLKNACHKAIGHIFDDSLIFEDKANFIMNALVNMSHNFMCEMSPDPMQLYEKFVVNLEKNMQATIKIHNEQRKDVN